MTKHWTHRLLEAFPATMMTRRLRRWLLWGLLGFALLITTANAWVMWRGSARLVRELEQLPQNEVGLVLGTSPTLVGGALNRFFEGRMDTASMLYHAGKVRHLLVSGDNRRKEYDEPSAMHAALLVRGVPDSAITLDYAGFRTLDSVARARKVFGLQQMTLITDDFHQPRALLLASHFGLESVGFASEHVPFRWSVKTLLRECGSRVKVLLDLYLFRTEPKFYGAPEVISGFEQKSAKEAKEDSK